MVPGCSQDGALWCCWCRSWPTQQAVSSPRPTNQHWSSWESGAAEASQAVSALGAQTLRQTCVLVLHLQISALGPGGPRPAPRAMEISHNSDTLPSPADQSPCP